VPPHGVGGKQSKLHVVLSLSGSTWIEARSGSTSGPGIVARGGLNLGGAGRTVDATIDPTVTIVSGKPVYVALGAPGNVSVTIGGHRVALPHLASGAWIRLDKRGAHAG